ncbi:S8 family peptidase [Clostridium sp. AN503]|uniref:S8 family peptidase n=1 Tax=Clostridium sp. AN503 TaxID=3160598 RepID=UPI00345A366B
MPACELYPASEEYADFIFQYSTRSTENIEEMTRATCINIISRDFAIVHARLDLIEPISIARDTYSTIPKLYGLEDTTALESSGITPVFDQPSLRATGRGVMIGIIDTGIDYTNPLFRLPDGTSRILSIWDQSIQGAQMPPPVSGFQPFYGTTYSQEQINQALASDDPFSIVPSRDTDGHGTFMAGVAAGNRITRPTSFSGAAPDASLAVVKLKPAKQYLRDFFLIPQDVPAYQENDIMAGLSYLLGLANIYQIPLVVYLGIGTSQGGHDGTSPLSIQIQTLTVRGFAAVTSAGNEVGYHHHYLGNTSENQEYEDVELRVGADDPGFCAELWARAPELYTVGFVSPSGEVVERIPIILGNETLIPFRLDSTRIALAYQNYEAGSGSQLIFMRFETPAPGIWHIRVYPSFSIAGTFHIWLPMHGFVSEQTIFLRSNPDTTITDPGNGATPLTVSTYNHTNNSIFIHSSRGYTRSLRIKPDLAAPGVDVQGPALSDGPEPAFTRRSGSSIAAAITAGAVADIFSWGFTDKNDENITGVSVKSMLIRGAGRNPAFRYPNREWGYGTLNLYQSFLDFRE